MASKTAKKKAQRRNTPATNGRNRQGVPPLRSVSPSKASGIDRRLLLAGGAIAVIVVAILVGVSIGGGGDDGPSATGFSGAAESAALLEGIAQDGAFLGSPDAPVTLVEYGDLQCPFCAQWSTLTFPTLVDEYVRSGDVRLEFRGLTFLDGNFGTTDSEEALRAVVAAGEQGKLWNMLELLYRNQGSEGSGWVTDDLIREAAERVPGLDVEQMLAARDTEATTTAIAQMSARADVSGVNGTPSFEAGPTGRQLAAVELTSLRPAGIRPVLDALVAG